MRAVELLLAHVVAKNDENLPEPEAVDLAGLRQKIEALGYRQPVDAGSKEE